MTHLMNAPTEKSQMRSKDKALTAAGVRIVRWHVKSIPDKQTIRAELHAQPMVEVNAGMEIEPANQSAQ